MNIQSPLFIPFKIKVLLFLCQKLKISRLKGQGKSSFSPSSRFIFNSVQFYFMLCFNMFCTQYNIKSFEISHQLNFIMRIKMWITQQINKSVSFAKTKNELLYIESVWIVRNMFFDAGLENISYIISYSFDIFPAINCMSPSKAVKWTSPPGWQLC